MHQNKNKPNFTIPGTSDTAMVLLAETIEMIIVIDRQISTIKGNYIASKHNEM